VGGAILLVTRRQLSGVDTPEERILAGDVVFALLSFIPGLTLAFMIAITAVMSSKLEACGPTITHFQVVLLAPVTVRNREHAYLKEQWTDVEIEHIP